MLQISSEYNEEPLQDLISVGIGVPERDLQIYFHF